MTDTAGLERPLITQGSSAERKSVHLLINNLGRYHHGRRIFLSILFLPQQSFGPNLPKL